MVKLTRLVKVSAAQDDQVHQRATHGVHDAAISGRITAFAYFRSSLTVTFSGACRTPRISCEARLNDASRAPAGSPRFVSCIRLFDGAAGSPLTLDYRRGIALSDAVQQWIEARHGGE